MSGGLQHVIDITTGTAKRMTTPAPATDAYLPWDSPGVETIRPDEAEKTAQIKAVMSKMQKHNFDKHRHCFRATHVKTQGVVKGKLHVRNDLPTHLQQGIFEKPGKEYDLIARYANEPFLLQDDKEPGPRGMAIKIFGVSGERLEDVPSSVSTQDFFFNNAPMLELTDIDTTLDIMSLREKYFDDANALGLALRTRTDQMKQLAPYSLPNTHVVGMEMFTQSAFRFGQWYGHMGLFPVKEEMKKEGEKTVDKNAPYGVLGDWLFDYFDGKEAKYEFRIQLGTSALHHPTEDASIVWSETTAPWQTLGTVSIPPQDSFDNARRTFWEDRMYLSPWRGLAAHRPLGSVNRLRKEVYHNSKETRDGINATKSVDVDSIDEIP